MELSQITPQAIARHLDSSLPLSLSFLRANLAVSGIYKLDPEVTFEAMPGSYSSVTVHLSARHSTQLLRLVESGVSASAQSLEVNVGLPRVHWRLVITDLLAPGTQERWAATQSWYVSQADFLIHYQSLILGFYAQCRERS